ncbi:hypothetical protein CC2G_012569 [Coprinopsis cinerea AmutBmut pab1-1]|nr:hypothetical protein CC2G_012569 [Coprinopsis cinerea AmutBmut pab1-1]
MSPIVVSTAQAVTTDEQPAARTDMNISRPSPLSKQAHTAKAERLRGGGAGKDCFLGLVGCFLCFGEPTSLRSAVNNADRENRVLRGML